MIQLLLVKLMSLLIDELSNSIRISDLSQTRLLIVGGREELHDFLYGPRLSTTPTPIATAVPNFYSFLIHLSIILNLITPNPLPPQVRPQPQILLQISRH